MHPLQAMVNGMAANWQAERADTQMTLGELIDRLEEMDPTVMIKGFGEPHSYRGYYVDLAFETMPDPIRVIDALLMCRDAMGREFEGYKGGDFVMGCNTPLWIAAYGCCGTRIMAISDDGTMTLEDEPCEFIS